MSILVNQDEFYKLASAQIVLDVLVNSIKKLNTSSPENSGQNEKISEEICNTKLSPFVEKFVKNLNNSNYSDNQCIDKKFLNTKRW